MVTDCLDFYDGAVGVVDADKLVTINTTNNKSHQMKFEGVEPVRGKIKDCSYSFWADQTSFYDSACVTGTTRQIVENLFDFAGNAANLNETLFGDLAKFYATKSEMRCKKANDNAYPKP
jgi:hypothetical protein